MYVILEIYLLIKIYIIEVRNILNYKYVYVIFNRKKLYMYKKEGVGVKFL